MKPIVLGGEGPPCPRCKRPTVIKAHREITHKQLRRAFYYTRWYRCMHDDCATTEIMDDRFKVKGTGEIDRLERDALARRHERLVGNAESVRPNPNVPIGWPSDGTRPPWEEVDH